MPADKKIRRASPKKAKTAGAVKRKKAVTIEMVSRFTPGPWHVDGTHPWMVKCPTTFPGVHGDVCEVGYKPNAYLIAAAPDLLLVLTELVYQFDSDQIRFTENANASRRQSLDAARGAIKRAQPPAWKLAKTGA